LCGSPLTNISRLPVCRECLQAIHPIECATCFVCGEGLAAHYPVSVGSGERLCGLCRRRRPPFQRAAAYGSYEGALRGLIHLLKYEQVRPAAGVLGGMLAQAIAHLSPSFGRDPVLFLPVPLHDEKLRQRGFNQSELAARCALRLVPKGAILVLDTGILQRRRATTSQIGLTRHQRRANVRGAFVVSQPSRIAGREVLLADDVFTTGTTVSECARVLRLAGASKVWVATAARTLKAGIQEPGLNNQLGLKRAAGWAAAA
jgi:ComF family protein